jgi:hypothetical protein
VAVARSPGLGPDGVAGADLVTAHEARTTARAVVGTYRAARAHHDDAGTTALSAVVDWINGSGQSTEPGRLTHLISLGFFARGAALVQEQAPLHLELIHQTSRLHTPSKIIPL